MSERSMHKNVWVLTIAQALVMTVNSVIVFAGGLVGATLTPHEQWATIPVAATVVGTALSTLPLGRLMKKFGRKKTFQGVLVLSVVIALLACASIKLQSFYLFCLSTFLFGMTSATVMQFRFAAMESVNSTQIPRAASTVLLGGIAAAFIGPEAALLGKNLFPTPYVGSFALLSVLFLLGLLAIQFYQTPDQAVETIEREAGTVRDFLKRPLFRMAVLSAVVGYAIMTFIMTATPMSMHVMDGHSLAHTKWVIQNHIIAMFLPSLITPKLLRVFGMKKTMIVGLFCYVMCIIIAYAGHSIPNYWVSLVLLGLGWNLLFIAGTALLPQSHQPEEKFKVQTLNDFLVFGAQAIASLSAGWFIFTLGWELLLFATVPIIVLHLQTLLRWRTNQSA